jgi:hypothetical protein
VFTSGANFFHYFAPEYEKNTSILPVTLAPEYEKNTSILPVTLEILQISINPKSRDRNIISLIQIPIC